MRHPFKASRHDPGRCAYCLRSLDCAPHLPLTPRATYPEPRLVPHSDTSTENPLRVYELLRELRRVGRAVQGER